MDRATSVAHIVAQTLCECDGFDWLLIASAQRDRYGRIGVLAEDRIRTALLDSINGIEIARTLIRNQPDVTTIFG